jgi:hypothetical protein
MPATPTQRRRRAPPKKAQPARRQKARPAAPFDNLFGPSRGEIRLDREARSAARKARKGAVNLAKGLAGKGVEASKRMRYTGRVYHLIERMGLRRALSPEELRMAKNLGYELGMTPKETADTIHAIYTDRAKKESFRQALAVNQQNPENWDTFNMVAGNFVDVAVKKRIIDPTKYK